MKKYLNKYTVAVLVIVILIAGFNINIFLDKVYLTQCMTDETFTMYIINEANGEILTNKEDDEQNRHLTLAEEEQIMTYLRGFEFGKAYSKGQNTAKANNWYGIYLHGTAQEMIYFAVYNYERSNNVQCSKFVRNVEFEAGFVNYLDSLFS